MRRHKAIAAAYLLDWVAGDPEWFPHPVRLMGHCIQRGERLLRYEGQTNSSELIAGGALTLGTVFLFYVGTAKALQWTRHIGRGAGIVSEVLLGWTCLASRNLIDEAGVVIDAVEIGNLPRARKQLSRIVGRDTEALEESEISRAVIETVAESSSDGICAPLFYMAIGGVPLAMAYKAINTLDSMIGHADDRYFLFGRVAARLDDVANFVPSRLTALATALAALVDSRTSARSAVRIWLRDGGKHKSPNAGQPESAMAGALQTRLGGANRYAGELLLLQPLGAEFPPPTASHARLCLRIVAMVSMIGFLAALTVSWRREG